MTDYLQKTEQERLESLQARQAENDRMTEQIAGANRKNESLREQFESLDKEYGLLQDQYIRSEEQKMRMKEALADTKKECAELQEKYNRILREKSQCMTQYTMLEKDFQEISARFRTCEAQFNTHYDLFKSFVDNDAERVLLLDTGYSLKYINHAALELFSVSDESDMLNRKIFDFMPYKDALRLKAKIDKAFIKGEKEKVKDVRFRLPGNALAKLKMKIVRVRYQEKPSVKLVIR